MYKKILITCSVVLGLLLASSANAQGYRSWWNYYFGGHNACHSHDGNYSGHYYWARFFWWHRHCPNQAPNADAGADQDVNVADTVTLDGSASSDADGFIRRYRWRQVAGPRVQLSGRRTPTATFVAPDVTQETQLVFVLRVKDNLRKRDRDSVVVSVTPVATGSPPVADAGVDQTVDEASAVTLEGSASSDPDNDITDYLWVQTAGTSVALSDANTVSASFTAPDVDVQETLEFSLTVTDSQANTASDTVSVTVEPVTPTSEINATTRAVDGSLVTGVSVEFYVDGVLRDDLSTTVDGSSTLVVDADVNYSVRASADGYADQVIPFRSAAEGGNVDLDVTLIARGAVITIAGAGSFAEEGSDGAGVSFTTSDFVDDEGNPVVGDIQLTITPVDVSQPATLAAFPGEFTGILEGSGDSTPIISLGTVEFEFTANGEHINLAPGATADVLIPIYNFTYQDGSNIQIGDTIPLWSLAEDTGIWTQEGTGTVVASIDSPTGLAMSATVSHFSWWNCDVSANAAQVEVTVLGAGNGTALIVGETTASIGWRPSSVNTTIPLNTTSNPLFIPASVETCLRAEVNFNDGTSVVTPSQCVTPAPNALISLTFGTGSTEPLDVLAVPQGVDDVVDLADFLGSPIDTVSLQPISVESSVSYAITAGALPAGISLVPTSATEAELVGSATEFGSFSATITATDDEANTDTIEVNLTIGQFAPPEIIGAREFFPVDNPIVTIDLNDYNIGGAVINWSIAEVLPTGYSFDNTTGILVIDTSQLSGGPIIDDIPTENEGGSFFFSEVTARNVGGSATVSMFVDFFGQEGLSFSIQGDFGSQF